MYAVSLYLMTAVAFVGVMWQQQKQGMFNCLFPAYVLYPALYYLVQWHERYRQPLMWTTLMGAAYVSVWVVTKCSWHRMCTRGETGG